MTWKSARLKNLCVDAGQYGLNVSANDYATSGYRLIRISDIDEAGSLRSRDNAVFVDIRLERRHHLEVGDLLLARSGATIGRSTRVGELEEPSTFAGYLVRFRPLATTDPRFIAYVAASHGFQDAVRSDAVTSTIQNFNAERYANISIVVPPLDEQRRIADFLDAETTRIDRLIEAQQSAIELVGERRKRVLEDVLISETTASVPLGYVTEYSRPIMYGIVLPGPNVEDGVPIVKGGDVAADRLSLAQLNKTTYEIEANFTRSRLKGGDLVIAIRGSVGEVAKVPDEIEGANLTQDAARIAPGPSIQARWLELVLETPSLQEQIGSRITGATVKGINIWDLRRVLIPQISVDEQSRAAKAAEGVLATIDDFKSSAKRQLLLLAERRQALITAAVTGGITV